MKALFAFLSILFVLSSLAMVAQSDQSGERHGQPEATKTTPSPTDPCGFNRNLPQCK